MRLAGAPGSVFENPLRRYPLPASPHEAATHAGDVLPVEELAPKLAEIRSRSAERLWIVELAGGLLVPYRMDWLQIDWLQQIRVPLVLVARSGLGTLNHTLLSVEAARARGLELAALFLVGERHPSNERTLIETTGIPHVFVLEPLAPLDQASVAKWVAVARSHRGASLGQVLVRPPRPHPPSAARQDSNPSAATPVR
ncbi:ATP-dependent dethiobiotin synthetase BioD [Planctomycetes bacterium Pla133]|uniref:ATP-dependent dethiobiotin synthetase BioD n=3 Tax=Engelhardtia mirabilis TaxID=2528011 RepID=A0A518BSI0_9BACT|nr:ATP-dependent dethiobiotin synthetase BioD [Planctomycetes bacterium Pla133]